jgi:acetyl esterase/lipase
MPDTVVIVLDAVMYLLKVIGAKAMRGMISLVIKFIAPSQTSAPKSAFTLHLDRAVCSGSNQSGSSKRRPPILIKVYLPGRSTSDENSEPLPSVINLHGSGFLLDTFGDDARFCQLIADQVNCVVFDVDYSKAPEHPFPCANEDADSVLEWIAENVALNKKLEEKRKGLCVCPDRVALTGFSSGGNLVLTTCVRAKDSGRLDMIKAVVAFYPS